MRTLVVDDSRTMRTILRRTLAELGHHDVEEAGHGVEALARFEERVPDLALVDWNMPVMGGRELVLALREVRAYDSARIVVVTSETSPRIVVEALRAGADEYAMKPVTADVVEAKLALLGLA